MTEKHDAGNAKRRNFLIKATTVVGGAGAGMVCLPFIASMNPSSDVLAKGITEVDLSGIHPGDTRVVAWQGKPVFVTRRTPEQIQAATQSDGVTQPEADSARVQKAEWLVVIGVCTHMGCVPSRDGAGWKCPCHGSLFDESGRVARGPAPSNLEVPPYRFTADNVIIIGEAQLPT